MKMASHSDDSDVDEELTRDLKSLDDLLQGELASERACERAPVEAGRLEQDQNLHKLQICLRKNLELQATLKEQLDKVEAALQVNKQKMDTVSNPKHNKAMFHRTLTFWSFRRGRYFRDHLGRPPPSGQQRGKEDLNNHDMHSDSPWIRPVNVKKLSDGVRSQVVESRTRPLLDQLHMVPETRQEQIKQQLTSIKNATDMELFEGTDLDFMDWKSLSYEMFGNNRSSANCRLHWTNHLSPLLNKGEWSQDEDRSLVKLAKKQGERDWVKIAKDLKTNRSPFDCLRHYQTCRTMSKGGKWTSDEDARLKEAISIYGPQNWIYVSNFVGNGRTSGNCYHRWTMSLSPDLKRGKWSKEEDTLLLEGVRVHGKRAWSKVCQFVPGRNQSQCRERYVNVVDKDIYKGSWSPEEDQLLMEACKPYKGKTIPWSRVAKEVAHRTDAMCTARWRQLNSDEEVFQQYTKQALKRATTTLDRSSKKIDGNVFGDSIPDSIKESLENFKRRYLGKERKKKKEIRTKYYPSPNSIASMDNSSFNDLLTFSHESVLRDLPPELLNSFKNEPQAQKTITSELATLLMSATQSAVNSSQASTSNAQSMDRQALEKALTGLLHRFIDSRSSGVEKAIPTEGPQEQSGAQTRSKKRGKQNPPESSQSHLTRPAAQSSCTVANSDILMSQSNSSTASFCGPSSNSSLLVNSSNTATMSTASMDTSIDWLDILMSQCESQSEMGGENPFMFAPPTHTSIKPLPASFRTPPSTRLSTDSTPHITHTVTPSEVTCSETPPIVTLDSNMITHPLCISHSEPHTVTPSTSAATHTLTPSTIEQPVSSDSGQISQKSGDQTAQQRVARDPTHGSAWTQTIKGKGDFPLGPRFVIRPVTHIPLDPVQHFRTGTSRTRGDKERETPPASRDARMACSSKQLVEAALDLDPMHTKAISAGDHISQQLPVPPVSRSSVVTAALRDGNSLATSRTLSDEFPTVHQDNEPIEMTFDPNQHSTRMSFDDTREPPGMMTSDPSREQPAIDDSQEMPTTKILEAIRTGCQLSDDEETTAHTLFVRDETMGYIALPTDYIMSRDYLVDLKVVDGVTLIATETNNLPPPLENPETIPDSEGDKTFDRSPSAESAAMTQSADSASCSADSPSYLMCPPPVDDAQAHPQTSLPDSTGSNLSELERVLAAQLLRFIPKYDYKSKQDLKQEKLNAFLCETGDFDILPYVAAEKEALIDADTYIVVYEPNTACHFFGPRGRYTAGSASRSSTTLPVLPKNRRIQQNTCTGNNRLGFFPNPTHSDGVIMTSLSNEDLISQHFALSCVPVPPVITTVEEMICTAVLSDYHYWIHVETSYEIGLSHCYCSYRKSRPARKISTKQRKPATRKSGRGKQRQKNGDLLSGSDSIATPPPPESEPPSAGGSNERKYKRGTKRKASSQKEPPSLPKQKRAKTAVGKSAKTAVNKSAKTAVSKSAKTAVSKSAKTSIAQVTTNPEASAVSVSDPSIYTSVKTKKDGGRKSVKRTAPAKRKQESKEESVDVPVQSRKRAKKSSRELFACGKRAISRELRVDSTHETATAGKVSNSEQESTSREGSFAISLTEAVKRRRSHLTKHPPAQ